MLRGARPRRVGTTALSVLRTLAEQRGEHLVEPLREWLGRLSIHQVLDAPTGLHSCDVTLKPTHPTDVTGVRRMHPPVSKITKARKFHQKLNVGICGLRFVAPRADHAGDLVKAPQSHHVEVKIVPRRRHPGDDAVVLESAGFDCVVRYESVLGSARSLALCHLWHATATFKAPWRRQRERGSVIREPGVDIGSRVSAALDEAGAEQLKLLIDRVLGGYPQRVNCDRLDLALLPGFTVSDHHP
jgi:hypothetical protein